MLEQRLQVFVSSTYTDLREERQAAVEAILMAGHVPAGMELFAAGDQSQMEVIRQWIADSDAFLLILGGRYGSIDPVSGKSYVHLEYEHALSLGMPLFACVVDESALETRLRQQGSEVIERSHPDKLIAFRQQVLSRIVRFWSDIKDIKLAIHESLGNIARRSDLRGWIRGDHAVNTGPLAEELARLAKENAELRKRFAESSAGAETISGLTYAEAKELLAASLVKPDPANSSFRRWQKTAQSDFGERRVSLLHVLWELRHDLADGFRPEDDLISVQLKALILRGMVRRSALTFFLTQDGHRFVNRLDFELAQRIQKSRRKTPKPAAGQSGGRK
jgi:hypothetical protein